MRKKRMILEDPELKRIAMALNTVAAGPRKEKKTQRASSPYRENIKGEKYKNNFWKRSDWIIGSAAVLEPHWPGGDTQGL
ncbi:hypothetical protein BDV27DRAFT_148440 [Aspergillus caelatus]|uniref:Uncharacterized protein n=1 Tax=Aspergillus caelatus TaxID=61420 RepID=A0A5N6ZT02_9EURO|nr:uncharacterized protein BDV27DRAFT_148440 [Aspergillus caelatus]KAE8360714.1 hypothetical protein BDV27DRAFT_148440 [Aspergillus caelatus]